MLQIRDLRAELTAATRETVALIAAPAFRRVLIRSVLVTLVLLVLFWIGAVWAFRTFIVEGLVSAGGFGGSTWLATAITAVGGLLLVGIAFLALLPLLVFVSRLFLPDIAAQARAAMAGAIGRDPPAGPADWREAVRDAARFALRSLLVYLVLLPLALIPGVNLLVFTSANAYLLGRHHFILAARETRSREEAVALYRRHRLTVIAAGLLVAIVSAVPLANLLAPSFAPLLMLRLHDQLARGEAARG